MSITPHPRRLTTIRAVACDPERVYPDAEVILSAETTEDPNLVVAAYPIRTGPFSEGLAGDFVVIHVPTGLPVCAGLTHSLAHARALAARLPASAVDWSRRTLSEQDKDLRVQVQQAISQFQRHDAPEHMRWEAG